MNTSERGGCTISFTVATDLPSLNWFAIMGGGGGNTNTCLRFASGGDGLGEAVSSAAYSSPTPLPAVNECYALFADSKSHIIMPVLFISFLLVGIQSFAVRAAVLSTYPTSLASTTDKISPPTTTLVELAYDDLRRRQDYPSRYCGFSSDFTWRCDDATNSCGGTILSDRNAYFYCSNSNLPTQSVFTTGVGPRESCPVDLGTWCW